MGRDATLYCLTCKEDIYLGYGSYGTWLDGVRTVAAYDAASSRQPEAATLVKNQRTRAALVQHEAHDFFIGSSDWLIFKGSQVLAEGPYGTDGEVLCDRAGWRHVGEDEPIPT